MNRLLAPPTTWDRNGSEDVEFVAFGSVDVGSVDDAAVSSGSDDVGSPVVEADACLP